MESSPSPKQMSHLVLYDGYCELCSSSVRLLLRLDKRERLSYLPLDSEDGQILLSKFGLEKEDTIVYVHREQARIRSDAALAIAHLLPWPWKALNVFKYVPKKWRDGIYMWVARNRNKWWGRRDQCYLPSDRSGLD